MAALGKRILDPLFTNIKLWSLVCCNDQCTLLVFYFFVLSQNLLEELRNEKEKLLREVEEFETKTSDLEKQLKESEEKLQLVVEFPSTDAKQPAQSDKGAAFNGEAPSEAEVAQDMERQVMANNIRIMTLEEQNEKLRKSIAYLMNARENISKKKVSIERIFGGGGV